MWADRTRECAQCGREVKGRIPPSKDVYCLDCNLARAKEAAIQMANKSGPYYDQWLETSGPKGRPPAK